MAGNNYRTANGKTLDMRALALKNEQTRAVGNMKVNARGDMINDENRVVKSKTAQVQKQYNQQIKK
jgi:hypothetical protein